MRRAAMVVLAITALALLLAGCGDFQRRAQEMEDRVVAAEQDAEVASSAAARNTAQLLALQDRFEALQTEIAELRVLLQDSVTAPAEAQPDDE